MEITVEQVKTAVAALGLDPENVKAVKIFPGRVEVWEFVLDSQGTRIRDSDGYSEIYKTIVIVK